MIERYADHAGEHRWRAVAANGRIVADSSEGYEHRSDRDHAAELTLRLLLDNLDNAGDIVDEWLAGRD